MNNTSITTSPFMRGHLSDDDFFNVQGNFGNAIVANATGWLLSSTRVAALVARRAEYEPLFHAVKDKNTRSNTDVVAHRRCRNIYEAELRTFYNEFISHNTTIPVEEKVQLGGREKDIKPTPLDPNIVLTAVPPIVQAKCIAPKNVQIDWFPSQAPGESESLPPGIDGVSIMYAEGGVPTDSSQWKFLALDTNSPYVHNVNNDSAVAIAYKAQWFDRLKRMGPFGNPVVVAVTP